MRSILVLCLAALLLVPAAASASRSATKSEKAGLNSAANRSSQTDYADCVKVRNITVSTKGPWAGATIQVCGEPTDVIYGVFRKKASGAWKLVATGNGSVGCGQVPARVARDLDLGC